MPHYAKCDVISRQNKKFKLKYLINKLNVAAQKYKRTCITVFSLHNKSFRVMGTLNALPIQYIKKTEKSYTCRDTLFDYEYRLGS